MLHDFPDMKRIWGGEDFHEDSLHFEIGEVAPFFFKPIKISIQVDDHCVLKKGIWYSQNFLEVFQMC